MIVQLAAVLAVPAINAFVLAIVSWAWTRSRSRPPTRTHHRTGGAR
ncbi:MAG: hypothetical protein ACRDSZ_15595 [Pseudonocardiaceae bacterium]